MRAIHFTDVFLSEDFMRLSKREANPRMRVRLLGLHHLQVSKMMLAQQQLEHQLQLLLRQQYGQRSEKQGAAKAASKKTAEAQTAPHGRNPLPDNFSHCAHFHLALCHASHSLDDA